MFARSLREEKRAAKVHWLPPQPHAGERTLLTRSRFGDAVKEALRHFDQTDLLAGNALLDADLLSRGGSDVATPQALKTLLVNTAAALFESERDRKPISIPRLNSRPPRRSWVCRSAPIAAIW
jgi:hypothetical protein